MKETGSGVALAGTLPAAHRFLGEVGWIDVTHLRLISQPAPMSVCLHVKASAWQRDEIWRVCVCVCVQLFSATASPGLWSLTPSRNERRHRGRL